MLMEVFKFATLGQARDFMEAVSRTDDRCAAPVEKDGVIMVTMFTDDPTDDELAEAEIQWAGYVPESGPCPW
jgi:hypothetical protein